MGRDRERRGGHDGEGQSERDQEDVMGRDRERPGGHDGGRDVRDIKRPGGCDVRDRERPRGHDEIVKDRERPRGCEVSDIEIHQRNQEDIMVKDRGRETKRTSWIQTSVPFVPDVLCFRPTTSLPILSPTRGTRGTRDGSIRKCPP
ncbi:hypothetical protein NHX12_011577 [Muraenolepis orangiensis]|uniref:Uncharacterized protein n=1 Tax=Muraenolepis orangiensis TaxID=630683 RepID=A0A9Q0I7S5_9TELE|nr:hypothetical protein NHX12_011577 [Muraenolepis orangiensis]